MITPGTIPVLVTPTLEGLGGYEDALARGWAPDPRRVGDDAYVAAELDALRRDRAAYVQKILSEPAPARAASPTALVNHAFWISDGEFAGKADLRYIPATRAVPDDIPGHVGFSIVPWKQNRAYATAALRALMKFARTKGLKTLHILCNPENMASRIVIERVGGKVYHIGPHASDQPRQMKIHYRVRL